MKNKIRNVAMAVSTLVAMLSAFAVQAADEELRKESQQAVADFLKTDSTMQKFLTDSAGYAVFPSVGKGGFIVGGARGKGIVYEKTNVIGQATMTQASIGAQIGGQTFAEIIFFETPAALNDFKAGKFEMSTEVSAVAAAEGASAAGKYKQGVAVFTLPKKGLMAQASIGGQKFKFEPESLEPTGRPTPKPDN
jgi:lipid-binding SYLF domain-containing protein